MPLVKRKLIVENDTTTFAKHDVEHVAYVAPKDVKPGDEIVQPTDRQLAELAEQYPDEYGDEAESRGVTPGGDVDTDGPTGFGAKIASMNSKDAVAAIKALDPDNDADSVTLWAAFEAEKARGEDEDDPHALQPRATVLGAFEAKGIRD